VIALSLAQVRAHLTRLVATVLAIVIAVGFVVATLVLDATTKNTVYQALSAKYAHSDLVVSPAEEFGEDPLARPTAVAGEIGAVPGVASVTADRSTGLQVRRPGRGGFHYSPVADVDPRRPRQWQRLTAGRLPTAPAEVAVDEKADLAVGSVLQVLPQPPVDANGEPVGRPVVQSVRVVGLVDLSGVLGAVGDQMFATVGQVGAWGAQGADDLRVVARPGVDPAVLAGRIRTALGRGAPSQLEIRTRDEQARHEAAAITRDAAGLTTVLLVFATVAVLVCALVIANTFAVLLAQRTRDLALLRCIGATGRQLRRSVLLESLLIGLGASLLGVGAGIGLAAAVARVAARFDSPIPLDDLAVPLSVIGIGVGIGVVVTTVASFVPTLRATRVAPLAALRPADAPSARTRAGLARRLFGLLLLVPSAAVLVHSALDGDLNLSVAAGCVTFVAVVLLARWVVPPAVGLVGRVVGPAGGVPGRLAASNAVRNPQRTAATATALIIGVTLTATMVVGAASTRATTTEGLDRAFPTDIEVDGDGTGARLPAGVLRAVSAVPDVASATALTGTQVVPDGRSGDDATRLLGIDPVRAAAVVRDTTAAGVPGPGRINVPTSQAEIWGQEGQSVTVRAGARSLTARVHLVGEENPPAVPAADLARLAPAAPVVTIWVRLADGIDADARRQALHTIEDRTAALAPGSTTRSSTEERDSYNQIIDVLLTVVVGLLGVAVVIAIIGVGNTMALSVVERRQESGLLRAMGLTRAQLRWTLLWEALLISGVASATGLALGTAYGLLGTSAALAREQALRVDVPVAQLLLILVIATAAGALASVLPSRRAARTSPVAAIASV
jgi:putative ABC transport system permease protein